MRIKELITNQRTVNILVILGVSLGLLLSIPTGKISLSWFFIPLVRENLVSLLYFSLIITALFSSGWTVIQVLGLKSSDTPDCFIQSGIWGIGVIATLILALGCIGLLFYESVLFILVAIILLAMKTGGILNETKTVVGSIFRQNNLVLIIALWIIMLSMVQLITGLLPPIGYDALEYHFGGPWYYHQTHAISAVPGNLYTHFPSVIEMLFTAGLVTGNIITAKLLLWFMILLTTGIIINLVRIHFNLISGVLAGGIFLSLPVLLNQTIQGNVDYGMALLGIASVDWLLRWNDSRHPRDLAVIGIYTSLAIGCKYISLVVVFLPVLIAIIYLGRKQERLSNFMSYCFCSLMFFLPWLMKSLILTGNPVYPLLNHWLPGGENSSLLLDKFNQYHAPQWQWAQLLTLHKELFYPYQMLGNAAPYALIPFLIIAWIFIPKTWTFKHKILSGVLMMSYAGWLLTNQVDRFLLPVIGLLCILMASAIGEGLYALKERPWKWQCGLGLIAVSVMLLNGIQQISFTNLLLSNVHQSNNTGSSTVGDDFLATYYSIEPSVRFINRTTLPGENILCLAEARRCYLKPAVFMNTVFDRDIFLEMAQSASSTDELKQRLEELHIRYIFQNPHEQKRLISFYGVTPETPESVSARQKIDAFITGYTEAVFNDRGMQVLRVN